MKDVWLCGASECLNFDESNEWRKDCQRWFESNSETFRAVNPNDYYNYSEQLHRTDFEIMEFCNHRVKQASIVLVNLSNIRKSVGSIMELSLAKQFRKPIVGFLEDTFYDEEENEITKVSSLKNQIHPWLYYTCDRIETGYDARLDALEYIEKYYGR